MCVVYAYRSCRFFQRTILATETAIQIRMPLALGPDPFPAPLTLGRISCAFASPRLRSGLAVETQNAYMYSIYEQIRTNAPATRVKIHSQAPLSHTLEGRVIAGRLVEYKASLSLVGRVRGRPQSLGSHVILGNDLARLTVL